MVLLTPIFLAFILSVVSYYSTKYIKIVFRYYDEITSFSAGIILTLIFFEFLPLLFDGNVLGRYTYGILFLGFILLHLSEKFVFQRVIKKKDLIKDLAYLHSSGFFLDHFALGFILTFFFLLKPLETILLLFVAFLLNVLSSALSLRNIRDKAEFGTLSRIFLSSSPFVGAVVISIFNLPQPVVNATLAFIIGMFLYLVVRDVLPEREKGKPVFLIIGIVLTSLITLFT